MVEKAARLLRGAFKERRFETLIFFVTSKCNARCDTCFYWDSLNQTGDLTFAEIDKMSRSMPQFKEVWFSGGEPTLRRELCEIAQMFIDRNGVRTVIIPTNAINTGRTCSVVERILTANPNLTLFVNVAVDGLFELHDKIRGVPGNFAMTERTVKELQKLRGRFPRYKLNVNTVINSDNYHNIRDLAEYIKREWDIDGHYFQIIRGGPKDPRLLAVPAEELRKIYDYAVRVHEYYATKLFADAPGIEFAFKRMYYVGTFLYHYKTQYANYAAGTNWDFPCLAGQTIAVVDYNGDFRACELRRPLGNLREYDMDFQRMLDSQALRDEVRDITENPCPCTHVCFIHDSLRHSPSTLLYRIPLNYAKYRLKGARS